MYRARSVARQQRAPQQPAARPAPKAAAPAPSAAPSQPLYVRPARLSAHAREQTFVGLTVGRPWEARAATSRPENYNMAALPKNLYEKSV